MTGGVCQVNMKHGICARAISIAGGADEICRTPSAGIGIYLTDGCDTYPEEDRMSQIATPGQIVILNGSPRSGKSSIAAAIQDTFAGV